MTALIDCARMKGYRAVVGDVLSTNAKMFRLMTSLGFTIHPHPDDTAVKRVVKPLTSTSCFLSHHKARPTFWSSTQSGFFSSSSFIHFV
jgi:hypothetical protein